MTAEDEGKIVGASTSRSADGRLGGHIVVETDSAEEAAAVAGGLLREALRMSGHEPDEAIVDYLHVEHEKPDE
jgi:hypothetical protein